MLLNDCLFVKIRNRNKIYKIEYREWITYRYVTSKSNNTYYMTKEYIDYPYWSEWKEFWIGNNPIKCRKLINESNKKWAGLKQYKLK